MKIIDRYIIRQYLINFLILFVVVMLLFVLIDFIVNMKWFVEAGQFRARRGRVVAVANELDVKPMVIERLVADGATPYRVAETLNLESPEDGQRLLRRVTPWRIMTVVGLVVAVADYYIPLALLLYVFFCGLIATGAMGFTFSNLHRNRELVAMLSSGVSMYRVAAPVIVVGGMLGAVNLPIQEVVLPRLAKKLTRQKEDLTQARSPAYAVHYARDELGNLLSAARFHESESLMRDVVILERDGDGLTRQRISAETATWDEARGGWNLEGGRRWIPQTGRSGDEGASGIVESEAVAFVPTQLSPTVLATRQAEFAKNLMPISTLRPLQNNQTLSAAARSGVTRTIWSRFSLVGLNVLVLVMGLPFFLVRGPTNMLLQSIKAAGVCIGAWAAGVVMLQFAGATMPPVVASWLPVVVFLPVSAVLLQLIKS